MKWKIPTMTKIYEAMGAVADGRVVVEGDTARVASSSKNKYYDIIYNSLEKKIMSNDNTSYWKGELGYPAIAFLMQTNVLSYDSNLGNLLKDIHWKDINQKFKNDFDKALDYILSSISERDRKVLEDFTRKVYEEIKELNLGLLGKKTIPPK